MRVRTQGENIRRFILENVEKHPSHITRKTAEHFKITRQAVNKHLHRLISEHALSQTGQTRNRSYQLASITEWRNKYQISSELAEDMIWTNDLMPVFGEMPENIRDIWHYGFTEMFNNVIDHSGGFEVIVHIKKTALFTEMALLDNGVGIFKKIQTELGLLDERHAILELSKGKLTTDPKHHTGEGIFFTSRIFDSFDILSGGVYFNHTFGSPEDWIIEREFESGTSVWMKLNNHSSRTCRKIFDQFSSGDDYGFTKTIVPVKLAQYGNDKLISRSQAKRVLARVELFQTVILDFSDVSTIGQAFADEIFRVFAQEHSNVKLMAIGQNSEVQRMIDRAKASKIESGS